MSSAKQPVSRVSSTPFLLILGLFFTSRLMLLLVIPTENLILYGDFRYYFDLADLTRHGFYPFIDYWQEYPPIFPFLNIAVYFVAGQEFKNYSLLLAILLLLIDSGNLYLLYRLGLTWRGQDQALQLAWIYTALFIPTFFLWGSFDALTTFFILLALYGLNRAKTGLTAVAIGLGMMVKLVPVLLIATVWRARGLRTALVCAGITLLISLLILGPFAWLSPAMTGASLLAQPSKSSYETVWALLDGNYTTGSFGPLADHFDPAQARRPLNNPARLPGWLRLIPFGLLGLFIFSRPRRLEDQPDTIVFTALTFIIFCLWSPGWSPQWQTFLIPLLLLALPETRAVLFIVGLGFVSFLEWPVILSRGLIQLLPLTIIIRTLLLIVLGFELYRTLTGPVVTSSPVRPDDRLPQR